jgi:hypothetical protein
MAALDDGPVIAPLHKQKQEWSYLLCLLGILSGSCHVDSQLEFATGSSSLGTENFRSVPLSLSVLGKLSCELLARPVVTDMLVELVP